MNQRLCVLLDLFREEHYQWVRARTCWLLYGCGPSATRSGPRRAMPWPRPPPHPGDHNVEQKGWTFDAVYTEAFSQRDIYLQTAHPVTESVLEGYNATIFA